MQPLNWDAASDVQFTSQTHQGMDSFKVFIGAPEHKPSKAEILRGLVTEKMTVAVRKIIAVVEATVDAQESEVLLLKEEVCRGKRQMDAILQPQSSHYKLETSGEFIVSTENRQSEVEVLREVVTETVSVAVREILAVVEKTVASYKSEVSSLKEQLDRQKTQMDAILQPKVILKKIDESRYRFQHEDKDCDDKFGGATETRTGVDDVSTKGSHEETLCSVSSPAHKEEHHNDDKIKYVHKKDREIKRIKRLPRRYRSNPDVTDTADRKKEWKPSEKKKLPPLNGKKKHSLKLAIGLLQNVPDIQLTTNAFRLKGPVQTITCPYRLNEISFFSQLRSTFPDLGENEPFEAFLTDSSNRSPRLTTKLTQMELYRAFQSCRKRLFAFYIQLKDNKDTCESPAITPAHNNKSCTSSHDEEPQSGTTGTSNGTDELDNMSVEDSDQSEEDNNDWSEDWKPEKNKEEEKTSDTQESKKTIRKRCFKRKKPQSSSDNSGPCKVCGVLFRSKTILTKHALSHLNDTKSVCGVCGQHLESSEELRCHLETHQKVHFCETCGCYFLNTFSFQKHIDSHKTEKPFICQFCQKCFSDSRFLKEHQLSHNDKLYKCDACPQAFRFKTMLDAHYRKHTGEKPFCCDICGKSLSDFRSLSRHKMIHTGEKNFSCKHCGKLFYASHLQKEHEKIHTVRERKYLCEICSKAFHKEAILRQHQKVHEGKNILKCSFCNKLLKGNLKQHMMIHKGEKPFSCSECGWKFRTRSRLKRHMISHQGLKPFSCTVCEYTCGQKHYLDVHMRTHTGDKPYKCTQCDKAFTQSHCLKTHMKCHQKEEQLA